MIKYTRIIGPKKRRVRTDRVKIGNDVLKGGISVFMLDGVKIEVTSIAQVTSAKRAIELFRKFPKLIRGGIDVDWLVSVQPKLESAAVAIYERKSKTTLDNPSAP